jgi:glycosyltransferase involved in cell wall biosynthesis
MKDSSLKISLVVPIFNEEDSLEKLVESINRQTFQPDEVILVDGGSTDKTVEVFERFCPPDSIYKLVKTGRATPGKGRNIGVENARNQWIAFTDAGITLDKDWLAELVKIVEINPTTEVVYGNSTGCFQKHFFLTNQHFREKVQRQIPRHCSLVSRRRVQKRRYLRQYQSQYYLSRFHNPEDNKIHLNTIY